MINRYEIDRSYDDSNVSAVMDNNVDYSPIVAIFYQEGLADAFVDYMNSVENIDGKK